MCITIPVLYLMLIGTLLVCSLAMQASTGASRAHGEVTKRPPVLISILPTAVGKPSLSEQLVPDLHYPILGGSIDPEIARVRVLTFLLKDKDLTFFACYPNGTYSNLSIYGDLQEDVALRADYDRFLKGLPPHERDEVAKKRIMPGSKPTETAAYQVVDVSMTGGYGPSLLDGKIVNLQQEIAYEMPLKRLPMSTETNVEALPLVLKTGPNGIGLKVLRKTPNSIVDEVGNLTKEERATVESLFKYSGIQLSTSVGASFKNVKDIDLVMRIKRTRWCDRPGPWFVVVVRQDGQLVTPDYNAYHTAMDPTNQVVEFECKVVETKVISETVVFSSFGKIVNMSGKNPKVVATGKWFGRTKSGWQVQLKEAELDDRLENGEVAMNTSWKLASREGKVYSGNEIGINSILKDFDCVTNLEFSKQKSTTIGDRTEFLDTVMGKWKNGPLGDAKVTVSHLRRKVHPRVTLRLPITYK